MERDITINPGIISKINYALTDLLESKSKERAHFNIPKNVDLSKVTLSFGQYKGRLVNQIWKLDKHYIKRLSRQDWLAKYPMEEMAVHTLLENQRLFRY